MQVHYFLVPPEGTTFQGPAEMRLRRIPGAFRHPDPRDPSWIVAASPQMARWLEAKLKQEPRTSLATQGMISLHPASIEIWQDAPREILSALEPFVTWVLQTWPCEVLSEEGEDWTARYAHDARALFYEEDEWA